MSAVRKNYQVSVGWLEVRAVWIDAKDADDAVAQAERDWSDQRALDWYECGEFEPPYFQVEDVETVEQEEAR